jgi:hypothetical protein
MSANITPMDPVVPHAVELSTIVINSAAEANAAHRRIVGSVQDAISIGEFLTMKKQSLPHGQWLTWLESNLEFDRRTSTNYMRIFDKRETVSHLGLTEAYKLLSAPVRDEDRKPEPKQNPTQAQPPKKEPASAFRPEEREAEIVGNNPDSKQEARDWMDPDELRRKSMSAPPMAMAQAWEIAQMISGWRESDVTFHKALDLVEEKVQLMRVGNNS